MTLGGHHFPDSMQMKFLETAPHFQLMVRLMSGSEHPHGEVRARGPRSSIPPLWGPAGGEGASPNPPHGSFASPLSLGERPAGDTGRREGASSCQAVGVSEVSSSVCSTRISDSIRVFKAHPPWGLKLLQMFERLHRLARLAEEPSLGIGQSCSSLLQSSTSWWAEKRGERRRGRHGSRRVGAGQMRGREGLCLRLQC